MFFSARQIGFTDILDVEDRILARQHLGKTRIEELMHLDWEERFDYFMQTCARHQEIWTVWDSSDIFIFHWCDNNQYPWDPFSTPLFPHKELAEYFFQDYQNLTFTPVPIDDFIDEILAPLDKEKIKCCIFPTGFSDETIVISAGDFVVDLGGCWEEVYQTELKIAPEIREEFLNYSVKLITKRQMKGRPVGKLP